jgi:hypothetical protein
MTMPSMNSKEFTSKKSNFRKKSPNSRKTSGNSKVVITINIKIAQPPNSSPDPKSIKKTKAVKESRVANKTTSICDQSLNTKLLLKEKSESIIKDINCMKADQTPVNMCLLPIS